MVLKVPVLVLVVDVVDDVVVVVVAVVVVVMLAAAVVSMVSILVVFINPAYMPGTLVIEVMPVTDPAPLLATALSAAAHH